MSPDEGERSAPEEVGSMEGLGVNFATLAILAALSLGALELRTITTFAENREFNPVDERGFD